MKQSSALHAWSSSLRRYSLICAAIVLLTFPLYLNAYRVSIGALVPIDINYRDMVMSLREGNLQSFTSPFGYRVLTPLLALPFTTFPPPRFSRTTPEVSQDWLQATFALCTVSYMFLLATTLLLYAFLRYLGISEKGIFCVLVIFWLAPARENYLYPLTDASAMCFIALLHYAYEKNNRPLFLGSSLIGVAAKEITIIVSALTCLFHLCFWPERRKRAAHYLLLLTPSVIIYLLARAILRFPGNEAQWSFWEYPARFMNFPAFFFNLRGILLNIYPLWPIMLAMIGVFSLRNTSPRVSRAFHWANAGVTLSLMIIGLAVDVKYNIGRIAFLSFPLFAPMLGHVSDRWLAQDASSNSDSSRERCSF